MAETLSESDGYFSYLGLKPGNYTMQVDPDQLGKLKYQSKPLQQKIVVKSSAEGDIVDGLNFVITKIND
ncbi:MAG: hypothetical protein IPF54_23875 [Draconibacterium sp.]|nr:hypothetical protein [Draconibacterium sp.]